MVADQNDPGGSAPHVEPNLPPLSYYAKVTAIVILVGLLAVTVWIVRGALITVLIGFLLAAGLDPLVQRMERRGLRRGLAVLVVLLAFLIVVGLFLWLGLRPAVAQSVEFAQRVPELMERLASRFGDTALASTLSSDEIAQQVRGALDDVAGFLAASAGLIVGGLASVVGVVVSAASVAAVTVFLMLALPRLESFAGRALADDTRVAVFAEAMSRVGGYVTGQLGVCACAGVTASIVFLLLGVPYAALLGLIVAALDAIPQFGATLGAILGAVVALTESLGTAVAVVIFFIVYQQAENFLIAPRVFASAVSLRPIGVFLSVMFGGAIGGIIGVIIALPVTAALKVVFRYVFRERLAAIEGRDVPDMLTRPQPKRRRRQRPEGEPPEQDPAVRTRSA